MSVGLIIMANDGIGPALLGTVARLLQAEPVNSKVLSIDRETPDGKELRDHLRVLINEVDEGDGVLLLTDAPMPAAAEVAASLRGITAVRIVAGLNLPMLLAVMRKRTEPLDRLAGAALEAGKAGIEDQTQG